MVRPEQKIVQYLEEAHATETTLVSVLTSQIAMTPRGAYRDGLEKHLGETRDHARRVQERLGELQHGRNPLQAVVGFTETLIGQSLALTKTPLDLLRGTGGEEKVLKNAKDACATEALEIATYTALERVATAVGDRDTARLAASIRGDEERMLQRILREIPKLADAVVGAEIKGNGSYDVTTTGAADTARAAASEGRRSARSAATKTRRTARAAAGEGRRTAERAAGEGRRTARRAAQEGSSAAQSTESRARSTAHEARRVPGVAQAEGQVRGAVASEEDLPITRYDQQTAEEIVHRLPELSQVELAKIDSYERRHDNRSTVLSRVETLRGSEPWPGYDEQTVSDITSALASADEQRARTVINYERSHKDRAGVIEAAERHTVNA